MEDEKLKAYLEAARKVSQKREYARKKNFDILLEYSEEQGLFHFNFVDRHTWLGQDSPSPFYLPVGYTSAGDYELFRCLCEKRNMAFKDTESFGEDTPTFSEVEQAFNDYTKMFL